MRKLQLSGGKGEKGGLRRSRDLAEGRHRGLGYPRGVKMGRWGEEPGREPREGTEFGETSAQGGWSGSLGRRGHPQREPGDGWGWERQWWGVAGGVAPGSARPRARWPVPHTFQLASCTPGSHTTGVGEDRAETAEAIGAFTQLPLTPSWRIG